MGTLITFENVGKIYHTGDIVYEALHDVNLTIDEGEMVVILGPSGAGKSTLLNMLGGLDARLFAILREYDRIVANYFSREVPVVDKEKLQGKYGIGKSIATLMQIQMVLVGLALILTAYGVTTSYHALPRMIVYILQAIACIAILVFGFFHFHKKDNRYFKAVLYSYAFLEAIRCALIGTDGVSRWAAIMARLLMVGLACLLVLLGEHLGEKKSNYIAFMIMFMEAALYLVFALGFVTERIIFKILPLVGILIAASICLFNTAKIKQREYFEGLQKEEG